jgi:hypothetical protein
LINPSMAATLFRAGFFFDAFLRGVGAGVFSSAGSAIFALADDGEVKICKNVLQAIRNLTVEVK